MRGVKRCTASTGRMRNHRYSTEFKATAVKLANAPSIETQAVAAALRVTFKFVGKDADSVDYEDYH